MAETEEIEAVYFDEDGFRYRACPHCGFVGRPYPEPHTEILPGGDWRDLWRAECPGCEARTDYQPNYDDALLAWNRPFHNRADCVEIMYDRPPKGAAL